MNWVVTSTGNMVEDFKIKRGDKFVCISDVKLNGSGDLLYKTGVVYTSESKDCITDEFGDKNRTWIYEPWDTTNWPDYFQRYEGEEYCGCKPDIDYYQAFKEEAHKHFKETINKADKDYFQSMQGEYGRRTFESGAVRDSNEGKSRPDLISPYFTERLGFRLAEGAKKYAERNWERGIPDEAFLESLERHLVAYKMGKTDEDHAAAIAFNIMGIIHNEEIRKL